MKKALVLFLVMAIAVVSLVMGCGGEVKTYSDSGQAIGVNVNKEFVIALGSNDLTPELVAPLVRAQRLLR